LTAYSGSAHERILYIDFTVDESDDDIESIDAVTFYRTHHDYVNSQNGYNPAVKIGNAASGLPSSWSDDKGDTIGAAATGIKFGELVPPATVIILDVDIQA
jgi:hypothetical protein